MPMPDYRTCNAGSRDTKALYIVYFFIIITNFVYFTSSVFGQTITTPQINKIFDSNGRIQYADKLYSFYGKIDNYLPSLSPSQNEWLNSELKQSRKIGKETNIWNRYFEITDSKEYKINYLKQIHTHIFELLTLTKKIIGTKKEIYIWSEMSIILLDREYWTILLSLIEMKIVDSKIFSKSLSSDTELFFLNNGVLPARAILNSILKPYLNDELPN